ncbi:MAG TPA: hypothetical protein VFQ87_03140 [Bradyrhizobium sp.]|jgi:hypothetical protein|nr:hypothetical protein [Bradyrhizobium sp.]
MLNVTQVLGRVLKLPDFRKVDASAFRLAVYAQTFTPDVDGTPTPYARRDFPNGAIIIGIDASACVPGGGASGQSSRNRQLFGLDFAYNGGEALVIDGPVNADALLGGGDNGQFPAKELIIAPNAAITCRAANLAGAAGLTVSVAYHTLIYRLAG